METENKSEAQESNSQNPTGIPVAPQVSNPEPTSGATENQPQTWYAILKKPILPQVKWTEVFGILGVVVGGLVCYIYWSQLQVMSRQLQEMQSGSLQTSQLIINAAHQTSETRTLSAQAKAQADRTKEIAETTAQQLELSQRPWVKIKHRIIQHLTFNHQPGTAIPGSGINTTFNQLAGKAPVATMVIEDTLENVGTTVALNVASWEDVIPVGFDNTHMIPTFNEIELRQKEWCDANRHRKASSLTGYILFPGDPWVETNTIGPTMAEVTKAAAESPAALAGRVQFVLVGCVCYRSSFEPPTSPAHETRFTYSLGKIIPNGAFYGFVLPIGVASDLELVAFPNGFSAD